MYSNLNFIAYNPSKEINDTDLFKLNITIIFKFASFSDVIIIITEGIILSYKLLSFLRKYTEKTKQPSFKLFLNFFLRIIPTIISIILIFICFYLFSNSLITVLHLNDRENEIYNTKIQHINANIMKCYHCTKDQKYLIPFYMQYTNYNVQDGLNEKLSVYTKDGWEVVSMIEDPLRTGLLRTTYTVFLRRPIRKN